MPWSPVDMSISISRRYLLPDEPTPQSSTAIELLAAIDTSENDVELRADMMANALLGPALGEHTMM